MNSSYEIYPLKVSFNNFINYCYIIVDSLSRDAMIIDPAWQIEKIKDKLIEVNANLTSILLTHSHYDHINLVNPLLSEFKVEVFMSSKEINYYGFRCNNLTSLYDMNVINFGTSSIKCLLTQGHTFGGMCYLLPDSIFTGDTIFIEGCGICSENGSSPKALFHSIQRIKRELPINVHVYPGHSYGKQPGYCLKYLLEKNIYFQIEKEDMFVKFRMRKYQKSLFNFK
ncbi:MBL fold metallo-hydrolase [Clostridium estertheticum]|uniref:MBL fold metallo-hydrolase n=1 Tax=Clostridium estertheticum TaxID=238834 RepID=UPI001CF2FDAC|nr:MBL fold metallo-hydrolase [Clostridium estertheticum]MCB2360156.1 MBL fold metallo-hydrolase [Clostridium estertheticum]